MSFSIEIESTEEGVNVVRVGGIAPRGKFTVNGHEPTEDSSKVATLGVTFTDTKNVFQMSANATRLT